MAAGRLLARSRVGLPAFDPAVLLGATALFGVVVVIACAVPLRRAIRIDAAASLRYE